MTHSSAVPEFALEDRLCELPYFEVVDQSVCLALAQQAVRREFDADEILFLEGEPSAGLWILEKGRIKIYKMSPEGREHILHIFGPGDSLNEIPAIDGEVNAVSAASISEVVAWILPTDVLGQAIETHQGLALQVIKVLGSRLRMLVGQIEGLALHSVTVRMARFLIEEASDPAFDTPAVTRATIASHLATTPETVSRVLRTLEENGAIEFDRHRIKIVDEAVLREIAML